MLYMPGTCNGHVSRCCQLNWALPASSGVASKESYMVVSCEREGGKNQLISVQDSFKSISENLLPCQQNDPPSKHGTLHVKQFTNTI